MNKTAYRRSNPQALRQAAGFSLIELMIALLLGLLVVAAASGVFISNKRVYAASETIGRIQESNRVAFEIMSRDIREAGGNPCGGAAAPVSMLNAGAAAFWNRYATGITGYAPADVLPMTAVGTGAGQRVSGTDAVEIHSALGGGTRVSAHSTPGGAIGVASTAAFAVNDVLMICNVSQSFVFQATALTPTTITHATGGTSLNCDADFDREGCGGTENYCFTDASAAGSCPTGSIAPAAVVRVGSIQWYVGNNGRGGTSLYRAQITNVSATATPNFQLSRDEIVEGVTGLTLTYIEQGDNAYAAASAATNWARVVAVRVVMTMEGADGALRNNELEGTDGERLVRTLSNVINLRNREGTL